MPHVEKQLGAYAQQAVGEVEFAHGEEFAVRRDLDPHLRVEYELRRPIRVEFRTASDRHRLGKRGQESPQHGIGLDRQVLVIHLLFDRIQPGVRVHIPRGNGEFRAAQFLGFLNVRQGTEELDTTHEIIDK